MTIFLLNYFYYVQATFLQKYKSNLNFTLPLTIKVNKTTTVVELKKTFDDIKKNIWIHSTNDINSKNICTKQLPYDEICFLKDTLKSNIGGYYLEKYFLCIKKNKKKQLKTEAINIIQKYYFKNYLSTRNWKNLIKNILNIKKNKILNAEKESQSQFKSLNKQALNNEMNKVYNKVYIPLRINNIFEYYIPKENVFFYIEFDDIDLKKFKTPIYKKCYFENKPTINKIIIVKKQGKILFLTSAVWSIILVIIIIIYGYRYNKYVNK